MKNVFRQVDVAEDTVSSIILNSIFEYFHPFRMKPAQISLLLSEVIYHQASDPCHSSGYFLGLCTLVITQGTLTLVENII